MTDARNNLILCHSCKGFVTLNSYDHEIIPTAKGFKCLNGVECEVKCQ